MQTYKTVSAKIMTPCLVIYIIMIFIIRMDDPFSYKSMCYKCYCNEKIKKVVFSCK